MSKTITDLPTEMNYLITSFVKAKPDEELSIEELIAKKDKLQELITQKERERDNRRVKDLREAGEKYVYIKGEKYATLAEYKIPIEKFVSMEDLIPMEFDAVNSREKNETISVDYYEEDDDTYVNPSTLRFCYKENVACSLFFEEDE